MKSNIKKITENVFQLIITYYNRWSVNVYLIVDEKLTLIDTGHYYEDSMNMLKDSLKMLGYEFKDLDSIIYTHPHADHAGGGLKISKKHKNITHVSYHASANILENLSEFSLQFLKRSEKFLSSRGKGAPRELIREAQDVFNIYNLAEPNLGLKVGKRVNNGDWLNLGKNRLQVIHTPSHTPWDISLYEPGQKLLFTGDFVLEKGTSLMSFLIDSDIDKYIASLKKIKQLDLNIILPGHGDMVDNPYQTIERSFKQSALMEKNILKVIKENKKTVPEIVDTLLTGNLSDSTIWYRYIGMVDTYLKKLINENKAIKLEETENTYYLNSAIADFAAASRRRV